MLFNRRGLFPFQAGGLGYGAKLSKFSWSSFLTNANKTLGVVNQTIPLFYQVGPMWRNAKTMFRVFGELKKTERDNNTQENNKPNTEENNSNVATKSSDDSNISSIKQTNEVNSPSFFI